MLMLSKILEDCSSANVVPAFRKCTQDGLDVERPNIIWDRKTEKLIQDLVNKETKKEVFNTSWCVLSEKYTLWNKYTVTLVWNQKTISNLAF